MNHESVDSELLKRLGYRREHRGWAKAEILLGLLAAGVVYQSGDNKIDCSCELYRRYLRTHLAR